MRSGESAPLAIPARAAPESDGCRLDSIQPVIQRKRRLAIVRSQEDVVPNWTRRGFLGSLSGAAAATSFAAQQNQTAPRPEMRTGRAPIKITDLRCAIIGRNPVVRIVTDQGISGYGQAESAKAYLKPMVLFYKDYLLGEDPTDVNRVMLKIRRMGAFKPWGSAVSSIQLALWDTSGQRARVPLSEV